MTELTVIAQICYEHRQLDVSFFNITKSTKTL